MSPVRVVAAREFRALVSSRAYRTGTLVGLVAVLAFGLVPQLAGRPPATPNGPRQPAAGAVAVVVDRAGALTPERVERLSEATGLRWVGWAQQFPGRPLPELTQLRRLAAEGRIAAYAVVDRPEVAGQGGSPAGELRWVVGGELDKGALRGVQAEADRLAALDRLRRVGVSPEAAAWLLAPAPVEWDPASLPARERRPANSGHGFAGSDPPMPRSDPLMPRSDPRMRGSDGHLPAVPAFDGPARGGAGAALLFLFVLYVTLVIYGTAVANGIAAEKGGRIVEMLLAAATPGELLRGKLWGMGQAAALQYVVWAAAAMATALATAGPGQVAAAGRLAVWAAVTFLLAFFGYAPLFAVAGSLAGRPEEVSQTTWLPLGVLVGAYLAAVAAMAAPDGGLATVASLLPFIGPLTLYARLSWVAVPPWQLAMSAALSVATGALAWRWAERVYGRWVLQTEGPRWFRWPWRRPRRRGPAAGREVPALPGAARPLGPGVG